MTMTGAEFQCNREYLGLSAKWVAESLGVSVRAVHRWETGVYRLPLDVEERMLAWLKATQQAVGVASVEARNRPGLSLGVTREDIAESDWPASWYRIVAARAAEIAGSRIEWMKE